MQTNSCLVPLRIVQPLVGLETPEKDAPGTLGFLFPAASAAAVAAVLPK